MAAPGSCGPGSASNPRKFSEKIALQRQRQAEDTAAFEEVMMDIGSTRVQVQKLRMNHMRGPYYGGSLPNVNQIGSGMADFQGSPHSPLDPARNTRHHGLVERVHRDPRRMMSPLRRHMRQIDSSPYGGSYLSPHQDHGVRRNLPWGSYPSDAGQMFRLPTALNRTNSDSALHTSLMNPSSQEPYHVPSQVVHPGSRRNVFPFPVPAIEENLQSGSKHLLKPCDTKKLSAATARPKSCEVPGINVYPSMDQTGTLPPVPSVLNTGGSLPDLTNLRSPLPAPLDPENSAYKSLSGGNSTGNLANTMTHLDISRVSLLPAFDMSGFSSLSRPSLQSSLSNPNLQTSLSSTSLQSSFSNPSLQSSLSSQSLPSSLSNQSLSPSASNHSLQSTYSTPSSPSSSCSFPPMAPTTMSTSPRRRVPLSPLTLPMGGESRRPHQKQFSPTMSPTLSSITQGVPLDTSKFTGDQRLPMYHFNPPNVLQQPQQLTQQAMHQSQHASQQPMHHSQHASQQAMHQTQHLVQQVAHQAQHPAQHSAHQSEHPSQAMHQPQNMTQMMHMHQPPQAPQQTIPSYQQPEQQTVMQPSHMSQLGRHATQVQTKQMEQQPLHAEQQMTHKSPPPSRQGMHQAQHPSQQGVHQGQHPSQQGVHQAQHPSQQGVHQAQHASRETVNEQHQHLSPPCQSQQHLQQSHEEHPPPYQDTHSPSMAHYFSLCQQNSGGQPYQHLLGDYNLNTFEQCNMEEGSNGRPSPSSVSFLEDYHHLLSGDLSENNIYNSQPVSKQNLNNGSRLDHIPNIILTAVDSPPGFSKEITSALSCIPGFEVDQSLGLDDDLNIEPLGLDGLNMLTDPYALLTDPLVEDSFRSDRLQ